MEKETTNKFTVIKGGLDAPLIKDKIFKEAYVTDTRLMGVVGLYLQWKVPCQDNAGGEYYIDYHQFFYYDAEEYGLETYRSILGCNPEEISIIESSLLGGLGGKEISVTKQEAFYLVKAFTEATKKLGQPLPEDAFDFQFMIDEAPDLTPKEEVALMTKMCDNIVSDYQLMNYFLMRSFGKDRQAVRFLSSAKAGEGLFSDIPMATFCKNSIDKCPGDNTEDSKAYLCESLIEHSNSYFLVVTEIWTHNLKVIEAKQISCFKVSPQEAAMMLARPEYVTVFDMITDEEELVESIITKLLPNTMVTTHENGKAFLSFNPDNRHVNHREFRLNEDVFGMIYVSDSNQLIISSFALQNILTLEFDVRRSPLHNYIIMNSKYEFKEPVMYEFMQSDFDSFEEFVDFIKE